LFQFQESLRPFQKAIVDIDSDSAE
jgi:hypothetical protein